MKRISTMAVVMMAAVPMALALTEDTSWNLTANGGGNDNAMASAHDPSSGDTFVVGDAEDVVTAGSKQDCWIKRYDNTGTEITAGIWPVAIDSGGLVDGCTDVAVCSSGRHLYVVGYGENLVSGSSGWDWRVQMYDATTSTLVWTRTYSSSGTNDDRAFGVDCDSGAAVVVGTWNDYASGSSNVDAVAKRILANGNTSWTHAYATNVTDAYYGVDIDPAGAVYMVGETFAGYTSLSNKDRLLDAVVTSNAAAITGWPFVEDGTNLAGVHRFKDDVATSVSVDEVNDIIYVGGIGTDLLSASSDSDSWVSAYDSTAGFLGQWRDDVSQTDWISGVSARQDATGFVASGWYDSWAIGPDNGDDFRVVSVDGSFATVDDQAFDFAGLDDHANGIDIIRSGGLAGEIIAVGNARATGPNDDWWVKKFNP